MALQLTINDIAAARIGLYGYFSLGLEEQEASYQQYIGGTINSKQAYEEVRYHAGLGLFKPRVEGDQIAVDDMPRRFTYRIYPIIHSLAIKHSSQVRMKDFYGIIKKQAPLMSKSAMATRNIMATNAFVNFAFPGGSSVGPDTLTIYNSSHTTVGATVQSNYGTDSISYTAIASAITNVRKQLLDRDDLPRPMKGGWNLWCGFNNEEPANRILNSMQVAGTNANDTSKWARDNIKNIVVDPYIGYLTTSTANAWGLLPAAKDENPFREMIIEGYRSEMQYDIFTDSWITAMHFENVFAPFGWQGTYANKP